MSQKHRHKISWQGHHIGYINNAELDMWYLDGVWEAIENEHTGQFLKLTGDRIFTEWQNHDFIWLGLDDAKPTWVFVGFLDEFICLRLVTSINPSAE